MELLIILGSLLLAAIFVVWKSRQKDTGPDDIYPLTCAEARAALDANREMLTRPLLPGDRAMAEARIAQFEQFIADHCEQ